VVHAKKEDGEEIKVMYDERKKFFSKPQVVIVCIVCIVVSTFPSQCGSFFFCTRTIRSVSLHWWCPVVCCDSAGTRTKLHKI
jgi:hypothetical protein